MIRKILNSPLAMSAVLLWVTPTLSQADWEPAAHTMLTEWGEAVTPDSVWKEYPRPQMVRENWMNLNGMWDFQVVDRMAPKPENWESQILVPFAIETPLSGVGKRLGDNECIWYRKLLNLPEQSPASPRTLLHFEGVDYACMVWVNGELAGSHKGGLLPFSFDISNLAKSGENELMLRVIDDTDAPDRYQLRGKQLRDNHGIWYTPSSGIWQTVWLESVPQTYIEAFKAVADMNGQLAVKTAVSGNSDGKEFVRLTLSENGETVASAIGCAGNATLRFSKAKLWSPDDPFLYDLRVELLAEDGTILDLVDSYVGFRTVGKKKDADGNWKFTLNGQEIFHWGPLDQGWWPGSFLNPPADEAIVYEMQFLKAVGFNMIRKHKKVEPRRYYYHADQIGLLIWQDQVSGGAGPNEWPSWKRLRAHKDDYEPNRPDLWKKGEKLNADWPDWAHEQYMVELKTMIDTLYNHPSVVVWTTFNERWAQHRSMEVGTWVKAYDPTRMLNIASGGNFFEVGDIADEHDYPDPTFPLNLPLFNDYIKVVGEFGGHGYPIEGHLWNPDMNNWGYGGLPKTIEEYRERYVRTANILGQLKASGVAAGVYTQTTDVEGELNGLMTYDRKVMKMLPEDIRKIHVEAGIIEK